MPSRAEQKLLKAKEAAFHAYYGSNENWDGGRWNDKLYPALEQPTRYAALINQYASRTEVNSVLTSEGDMLENFQVLALPLLPSDFKAMNDPTSNTGRRMLLLERRLSKAKAISKEEGNSEVYLFPTPKALPLMSHWNMDATSALSAHMLDVQPGDRVLDLCAAPGGKSVAIAQVMFDNNAKGCLHVNELDYQRNKRLQTNLKAYLPLALFQPNNNEATVRVLQLDAAAPFAVARLPLGPAGYDRVLLDAPCSSERHVVHAHIKALAQGRTAQELARWSRNGTKTMAKIQTDMLMTALRAVKMQGRVVYSTCSISSEENDGVIERALVASERERNKGKINWKFVLELGSQNTLLNMSEPGDAVLNQLSEETKYGRISLPDHPGGGRWGPLYFCVIKKLPAN